MVFPRLILGWKATNRRRATVEAISRDVDGFVCPVSNRRKRPKHNGFDFHAREGRHPLYPHHSRILHRMSGGRSIRPAWEFQAASVLLGYRPQDLSSASRELVPPMWS